MTEHTAHVTAFTEAERDALIAELEKHGPRDPQLPEKEDSFRTEGITQGLGYLHCYVNGRPSDLTTCGQAAIATITDYSGLNPYSLPRVKSDPDDGKMYWDDGAAIDAIVNGGFKPDAAGGALGTTGGGIADALRAYGLKPTVCYSGVGDIGWGDIWNGVQKSVAANRPVPVLVDSNPFTGSSGPHYHWPVLYGIDQNAQTVQLGNFRVQNFDDGPVDIAKFLDAWACHWLGNGMGFNHCCVLS